MTKQDLLNQIYHEIDFSDGELEEYKIIWKDIFGAQNYISINDIAYSNEMYAWYETSDIGKDKVKIKWNESLIIEWNLHINAMGISNGGCKFFDFFESFLIVCFADKHRDRFALFNLKTLKIEEISLDGYRKEIFKNGNEIIIKESYSKSDFDNYKITIFEDTFSKEVSTEML
jgi:hypothetical protein